MMKRARPRPPRLKVHLEHIRRRAGLTQTDLAHRTGLSQSAISAIERGAVANPSWMMVALLSRAVGSDPHEVFPWKF